MEAKKLMLAAKQECLDAAFEQAKKKLLALPDDKYAELLAKMAVKASATGKEEVLLNAKDRKRVGEQVVAALRSVDLIPCTNCGYCVKDCPDGVKIPVAMNLLNLEKTTDDREFAKGLYSWQAAEGPASKCVQCAVCEAMCPQSIPIIDHLAEAVEHFEG